MAISISISISQNSQNITNNTSNVTVKVNASWTYGSFNRTAKSGWLKIDGTTYNFTSTFNTGQSTSGSQTLFTKTVDITHNSDGTKNLACSASFTSGVSSGTVTAATSKILTTIPRKSTLAASNGTLGTAQTLTVTRKSSSFTHTISYKCGTATGTIVSKSSSTSISFTPPLTLSNQNTTGTSVSITFTITTYNGNTSIGSNSKTISCAIPSSVKPTCTITVEDSTGYLSTYGGYIKGLSKFKVTVKPTISYGSAIATYKTTANGATYTTATFTTGVLKSSGTLKIESTVTDKRGRSGTASVSVNVLNYSAPHISSLIVRRSNADGTVNQKGEYATVTFSATATNLNNSNVVSYSLKYKKTSETTYTTVELTNLKNNFSVTNSSYTFKADGNSSYNIDLEVADNFGKAKKSISVSTAFTLINFNKSGNAMAIGKVSETPNAFEVGLKLMTLFGEIPVTPIHLSSNQDLNNLLDTGYYIIGNTTISPTILNKPSNLSSDSGTAFIEVYPAGDGYQKIQRFTLSSKTNQWIYQRVYYQNAWGDWFTVAGCTDWRNLTIASNFEVYGTNSEPKYRVNGNLVTITGAVKPTTTITSNTTGVVFASGIPAIYRPKVSLQFVCQGSGINRWLLSLATNGDLTVSRYGTNDYVDIPAGAWLTFTITYSI